MEKIYLPRPSACRLAKACPETVQFLLDYSKAVQIVEYQELEFESIKN